MELKLRKIGNSVGVVLPKEALSRLKLGNGDRIWLTEAPDGYKLTPYAPGFSDQIEAARRIMKKRRVALRELAK